MESDAPHLEKVRANQMNNYQNENSQEKNDLYKKRKNAMTHLTHRRLREVHSLRRSARPDS